MLKIAKEPILIELKKMVLTSDSSTSIADLTMFSVHVSRVPASCVRKQIRPGRRGLGGGGVLDDVGDVGGGQRQGDGEKCKGQHLWIQR